MMEGPLVMESCIVPHSLVSGLPKKESTQIPPVPFVVQLRGSAVASTGFETKFSRTAVPLVKSTRAVCGNDR